MDIIAPNIKDKIMFNSISLTPKINPKVEIKVTSPPPIPPLDIKIININKTPDIKRPSKLFIMSGDILYIIWFKILFNKENINI